MTPPKPELASNRQELQEAFTILYIAICRAPGLQGHDRIHASSPTGAPQNRPSKKKASMVVIYGRAIDLNGGEVISLNTTAWIQHGVMWKVEI